MGLSKTSHSSYAKLFQKLELLNMPNELDAKRQMNYTNPWNQLYQKILVNIPGDSKLGSLLYVSLRNQLYLSHLLFDG